MVEDILKSIKAHLYDRTVSPLFGAFVTSWALWNHRFIMAIVYGDGLQEKYDMMDKAICNSLWYPHIWLQFIVFPLGTALFYIYAYPLPARWIYSFSKRQQEKLNAIKNEIENNRRLTVEESRKITAQHILMENDYQNKINSLNSNIEALKSNLESAEKQLFEYEQIINQYTNSSKNDNSEQKRTQKEYDARKRW